MLFRVRSSIGIKIGIGIGMGMGRREDGMHFGLEGEGEFVEHFVRIARFDLVHDRPLEAV